MDTLTLLLSLLDINLRWDAHESLCDWTYLKKILHHGHYWLLAICPGIFHMECSSCSTTVFTDDLNPQMLSSAIERVYSDFFCSDSAQHLWYIAEEILFGHLIWSLHDHLEWCFQMGACLRRYRIQKWEWKFKCSHSFTLRTTSISCFDMWKFIFQTCNS